MNDGKQVAPTEREKFEAGIRALEKLVLDAEQTPAHERNDERVAILRKRLAMAKKVFADYAEIPPSREQTAKAALNTAAAALAPKVQKVLPGADPDEATRLAGLFGPLDTERKAVAEATALDGADSTRRCRLVQELYRLFDVTAREVFGSGSDNWARLARMGGAAI